MDGHGFITKTKQDMVKDTKLMQEITMPELARILVNGKPVKELDLGTKFIKLREDYGLDYIVALPKSRRPPMVRFWEINKTKELSEELNEHYNDKGTSWR